MKPPIATFWPRSAPQSQFHVNDTAIMAKAYGSTTAFNLGMCRVTCFWFRNCFDEKCNARHDPLTPYEICWILWLNGYDFLRRYLICFMPHKSEVDIFMKIRDKESPGVTETRDAVLGRLLKNSDINIPTVCRPAPPGYGYEHEHKERRADMFAAPKGDLGMFVASRGDDLSHTEWTRAYEIYHRYYLRHPDFRRRAPIIPRNLWSKSALPDECMFNPQDFVSTDD